MTLNPRLVIDYPDPTLSSTSVALCNNSAPLDLIKLLALGILTILRLLSTCALLLSISNRAYAEKLNIGDRFAMEFEHGSLNLSIDSFGFWKVNCSSTKDCYLSEENYYCANKSKGEISINESKAISAEEGTLKVLKINSESLKFSIKDGDKDHYICSFTLAPGSSNSASRVTNAVCESDSNASKWFMPKKEIDLFARCSTIKAHGQI